MFPNKCPKRGVPKKKSENVITFLVKLTETNVTKSQQRNAKTFLANKRKRNAGKFHEMFATPCKVEWKKSIATRCLVRCAMTLPSRYPVKKRGQGAKKLPARSHVQ